MIEYYAIIYLKQHANINVVEDLFTTQTLSKKQNYQFACGGAVSRA